jgi:hypothetical protein
VRRREPPRRRDDARPHADADRRGVRAVAARPCAGTGRTATAAAARARAWTLLVGLLGYRFVFVLTFVQPCESVRTLFSRPAMVTRVHSILA